MRARRLCIIALGHARPRIAATGEATWAHHGGAADAHGKAVRLGRVILLTCGAAVCRPFPPAPIVRLASFVAKVAGKE